MRDPISFYTVDGFWKTKYQIKEEVRTLEERMTILEQQKKLIKLPTRLKRIWNAFGELNQIEKLKEEAKEFLESLEDEEIVDVFLVSAQHVLNRDLFDLVDYKLDRTEKRIEEDFYD